MVFYKKIKDFFGLKNDNSFEVGGNVINDTPLTSIFGGSDPFVALQVSTVLQCVSLLANGVSQVPFKLMRKNGRTREEATDHELYWLFTDMPNRWQTAFEFWQMVMFNLTLSGECVVWKIKVRDKIKELIPFSDGNWYVEQKSVGGWWKNSYHLIKDDGSIVVVPEEDIWHIRWREYDIRRALPQMRVASQVLQIALEQGAYAKNFMQNSASPSMLMISKNVLNAEQFERISKAFEERYSGAKTAGKIMLLGADFEPKPLGMKNTDAQFIESRKLQIDEVCRCFGVNPHMCYSFEKTASYSNSEQMTLDFLVFTMSPWYTRIENSSRSSLLTKNEKRNEGLYLAFNDTAMLRSDSKARAEFYRLMVSNGIYTINEARGYEELAPIDGGDISIVNGTMIPLKMTGEQYKREQSKQVFSSTEDNEKEKDGEDDERRDSSDN